MFEILIIIAIAFALYIPISLSLIIKRHLDFEFNQKNNDYPVFSRRQLYLTWKEYTELEKEKDAEVKQSKLHEEVLKYYNSSKDKKWKPSEEIEGKMREHLKQYSSAKIMLNIHRAQLETNRNAKLSETNLESLEEEFLKKYYRNYEKLLIEDIHDRYECWIENLAGSKLQL